MNVKETLNERGNNYGDYNEQSARAQEIQRALHLDDPKFTDFERDALQMLAVKLSRITYGNPHYVDNWTDIAGYATLVKDILERDDGTNS